MIDFSQLSSADIFNQTIVPILQDLDENALRIQERRQQQDQLLMNESAQTADIIGSFAPTSVNQDVVDYNAPINAAPVVPAQVSAQSQPQQQSIPQSGFKLSNYGYASDSSPDYNSNVLRIGHANNKLEDGVSAALTKSLAKRYGLKTGDMFEIVTADGKTMVRRYDDTVPTTYKGKPLPETIDLYNTKGSNSFGGRVTSLRKL